LNWNLFLRFFLFCKSYERNHQTLASKFQISKWWRNDKW
jgi:hypothetical protein